MTTRRLLRVITRLNIGGPARQALALTRHLRPEWDTLLAAGRPSPSEGEMSDSEVAVATVPLVRPLSPVDDARALLAVRGLLRRHQPHLVHTHMAKAGTIARIAVATSWPRARTVHTFHGHVLEGYFRPSVQRAFIATERWLASRTDVLVAVSDHVRDELLALGIGQEHQYRVIRLGFDLDEHLAVRGHTGQLRSQLGLDDTTPLVGFIGRLVPIKAVDLLLDAFINTPRNAHLVIVGDGDLRADLEARSRTPDLAGRVHFTGWRHDVATVMADLDVVVLTSRNEGTPVSLIEAAACGRPVVATAVGGVPAVVDHEGTGLLVRSGAKDEIAAALTRLIGDDELRRRLGEEGRGQSARFLLSRLVGEVRALYDELVPRQ